MNIEQDIDFELARLRKLAYKMDALVRIPGTKVTIGLDSFFGLIPVFGDLLALVPGVWMIGRARKMGASPGTLAYMGMNTALDFAIGLIPVVGDIFDAIYNANIKNFNALERNLNIKAARAKPVRTTEITLGFATS